MKTIEVACNQIKPSTADTILLNISKDHVKIDNDNCNSKQTEKRCEIVTKVPIMEKPKINFVDNVS